MSADPGIRLHRRQLVVGPQEHHLGNDWISADLDRGLVLSHCPELPVVRQRDADGVEWLLIGLAVQTRSDRPPPVDDLAGTPTSGVPAAYEGWAGRWILIGQGELHLDAAGQLGCHWLIDQGGRTWASTSPAAVAELGADRPHHRRDLRYERGLSWVVPPVGTVEGAGRLLVSQILDLRTGTTRWRRLAVPRSELGLGPATGKGSADEAALAGFLDAIGRAITRLPADQPRRLGLTAGADSRLILAAALAAGAEVRLHTRLAARMSVADRLIPPRLAAAVGLDHRLLPAGRFDPERLALARAHSAGHVSDGDALPFATGVRDHLDGIELGGHGLGIGKVKHRDLPAEIDDPARLAELLADRLGEPDPSPSRPALATWLAAVAEHERTQEPDERVDWRDRIYLEQRTAGWQAAKEQVYDLNRHQRFFPINSARTIGLLLAVDPERRRRGDHRRDLIAMAEPRLLAEPFNPPGRAFSRRVQLGHALSIDPRGLPGRLRRRLVGR